MYSFQCFDGYVAMVITETAPTQDLKEVSQIQPEEGFVD